MMVNNGDKAWDLLVGQVTRIETLAKSTDSKLSGIEAKVSSLNCIKHGKMIEDNARAVAEIRDTLKHRMGWRALLVACIGAASAGLMAGAKFL